jgi:uroporphyrinogen-III decarboxylase
MTDRERILAALRRQPVDRFPVWLKMANQTWQNPQPEPYRTMEAVALMRAVGCDVMQWISLKYRRELPHVRTTVTEEHGVRRTVSETPEGPLIAETMYDPLTCTRHPTRFPADTPERVRALRWLFTDVRYVITEADRVAHQERQRGLAADGIFTMMGIGPSPLMNLMQELCGPEATIFLRADEPELFAETLALMHADRQRELAAILPHVRADSFWLTENTSTSLISPEMFADICVPHLRDYGQAIRAHGRIAVHHMCGLLNALLEMIDGLPAEANEAFTTRPVGNTSLTEGRTRMPRKALIGGTNAALWLQPAEVIVRTVAEDLATCPDRRGIVLTSAGVLPADVSFAKARQVVAEFKRLPV